MKYLPPWPSFGPPLGFTSRGGKRRNRRRPFRHRRRSRPHPFRPVPYSTIPSEVAKSVQSRPRRVLRPGWNFVQSCRTMIQSGEGRSLSVSGKAGPALLVQLHRSSQRRGRGSFPSEAPASGSASPFGGSPAPSCRSC